MKCGPRLDDPVRFRAAQRLQTITFGLEASFNGFVDLGDSRDMAIWQIVLTSDEGAGSLTIGSVHLTPKDPARGNEMLKLVDWILAHQMEDTIVLGDMNWGYRRVANIENYFGEEALGNLHREGKTIQVFRDISYVGKGTDENFRTNLGFRSTPQFYDQIFLSPSLRLAHGGELFRDCGFVAFALSAGYFGDSKNLAADRRQYGLKRLKNNENVDSDSDPLHAAFSRAELEAERAAAEDATWAISDHRPVWVQISF